MGGSFNLLGISLSSLITLLFFWSLNLLLLFKGMGVIRVFENIAAPLVLVLALLLAVFVIYKGGGLGPYFSNSRSLPLGEFLSLFPKSLMSMIAYWTQLSLNIPDFTRFGSSHRQQMWGQVLGLPTTMTAFSFLGIVITSAAMGFLVDTPASELWDPIRLLALITSAQPPPGMAEPVIPNTLLRWVVSVVAVAGVVVATISVNIAANCVSPSNDFMNVMPTRLTFRKGAMIAGIVALCYLPWKLLASSQTFVFDWLLGYSVFLGPAAGVLIVDYHWWRRRRLSLADLYRENGVYGHYSWTAIVTLLFAIFVNLPGLIYHNLPWKDPAWDWLETMHEFGLLTGFVASMSLYFLIKNVEAAASVSVPKKIIDPESVITEASVLVEDEPLCDDDDDENDDQLPIEVYPPKESIDETNHS